MGECVGLRIGNYEFLSYKNSFGDLLSIYSQDDLKIEDVTDQEIGERITKRYFTTTVGRAKMCLNVMGHTITNAKSLFELNKTGYLDNLKGEKINENDLRKVNESYTFDNWVKAVKKYSLILATDVWENDDYKLLNQHRNIKNSICEKIVLESLPFDNNETFFSIDYLYLCKKIGSIWDVFRVVLEAFKEEELITLDYTDLFEGGWCDCVPAEKEYSVPKTIILTEGSSDAGIISDVMKLLYPYMVKFYSFIDFSTYSVQGSTNYLTHYLKVFIAAGIQNRIIALYDNDSAGLSEIKCLGKITLPSNVRIMHLPDLDICKHYPTIGPAGESIDDINGRACSIEMFLGKDVLAINGKYSPIRWKAYIEKVDAYQGEIVSKSEILEKFRKKLKRNNDAIVLEDWEECNLLLKEIFKAFL